MARALVFKGKSATFHAEEAGNGCVSICFSSRDVTWRMVLEDYATAELRDFLIAITATPSAPSPDGGTSEASGAT